MCIFSAVLTHVLWNILRIWMSQSKLNALKVCQTIIHQWFIILTLTSFISPSINMLCSCPKFLKAYWLMFEGSCKQLIEVVEATKSSQKDNAFHWSSFGSWQSWVGNRWQHNNVSILLVGWAFSICYSNSNTSRSPVRNDVYSVHKVSQRHWKVVK